MADSNSILSSERKEKEEVIDKALRPTRLKDYAGQDGIREQLEKMGYEVETRIVECQEERSSETVAKKLNLLPGESVFKIKRVRYIKGDPISLHISYINARYKEKLTVEMIEKEQLCVL